MGIGDGVTHLHIRCVYTNLLFTGGLGGEMGDHAV